jgi:hypothetical protein
LDHDVLPVSPVPVVVIAIQAIYLVIEWWNFVAKLFALQPYHSLKIDKRVVRVWPLVQDPLETGINQTPGNLLLFNFHYQFIDKTLLCRQSRFQNRIDLFFIRYQTKIIETLGTGRITEYS